MSGEGCVFCDIIQGKVEASIVYQNEVVIAIMDQRQANPGHVLVIPKRHFPDIYTLSEEAGLAIMRSLLPLSRALKQAFKAEGLSIWQSNGVPAGQEVPHVHFHIHPRQTADGLLNVYSVPPRSPAREVLERYAQNIRNCL